MDLKFPSSIITSLEVQDVRFPTSLSLDGSDAIHPGPDYSASYVTITTDTGHTGNGIAFSLGRGNEIICHCIDSLRFLVLDQSIKDIFNDMGSWLYKVNNEGQLRWLGPEKGVIGMAVAGIVNSLWDLLGKMEGKPVWQLLTDMTPEQIISLVDFKYIEDCITKEEALALLQEKQATADERKAKLLSKGLPAYTTAAGWLGYSDQKVKNLCQKFMDEGFTAFKMKVGVSVEDDRRRCAVMREAIGWENKLMVDANQVWGVQEAIDWMKQLAEFKLYWIEEPTNPDDIIGHKMISEALREDGIGVATGETCQNRIMFKQFLATGGLQFCQIDSARMSGLNEVIAVYLMAAKLKIPVCPHAGGVGLCQMVPHLQAFDYVALSGTTDNRITEYVDHLEEHFVHPTKVVKARYMPSTEPGYGTEFLEQSVKDHVYPTGARWKELFSSGQYKDPSLARKKEAMIHN